MLRPLSMLTGVALLIAACGTDTNLPADDAAEPHSTTVPTRPSCDGEPAERATVQYVERIGTDATRTSLDVYAPLDAVGCPAIIWVHGGSYQAGSNRTRSTAVKVDHVVASGTVFIAANYRLSAPENDVRWPDHGDDIAAVVAWVHEHAAEIGVDPAQITLMGHSAGAHLVSIVGTNPDLLGRVGLGRDALACVVSLDSVTHDLTQPPRWEQEIIDLAFDRDDASLVDGSPTLQTIEHAGDPTPAPSFLIVTRGRPERIESSERLAAELRVAGSSAQVLDVSPYDHGEASTSYGARGEIRLTEPVDAFLESCR